MLFRAAFTYLSALALAAAVSAGSPATAEAQFGKRLKDAVKRTAEDKGHSKGDGRGKQGHRQRAGGRWGAASRGRCRA